MGKHQSCRWRAFCDAWLSIGLAAELVNVVSGLLEAHDARERVEKLVGRVVAEELPWRCARCNGGGWYILQGPSSTSGCMVTCERCKGTGRR